MEQSETNVYISTLVKRSEDIEKDLNKLIAQKFKVFIINEETVLFLEKLKLVLEGIEDINERTLVFNKKILERSKDNLNLFS